MNCPICSVLMLEVTEERPSMWNGVPIKHVWATFFRCKECDQEYFTPEQAKTYGYFVKL